MRTISLSKWAQFLADAAVYTAAWFVAFQIRFDADVPERELPRLIAFMLPYAFGLVAANLICGIYRLTWRYVTAADALRISAVSLSYSVVLVVSCVTFRSSIDALRVPLSCIAIAFVLSTCGSISARMVRRTMYMRSSARRDHLKRYVIVGAGSQGVTVAREIMQRDDTKVIGFVDDDPKKAGALIAGIPVLGPISDLARIVTTHRVDEFLICIPPRLRKQLDVSDVTLSDGSTVQSHVIPTIEELLNKPLSPAHESSLSQSSGGNNGNGTKAVVATSEQSREPSNNNNGERFPSNGNHDASASTELPSLRYDILGDKGRVLVVGGAGYIGSLLVEKLLQSGYKVRVLDALLYGKEPLRAVQNHPNFQLMVGDCRNIRDMVAAVREVETIVDLAAIVGDPACEQDQCAAREINYGATRMMVEVAKGDGVSRFLFASSCSVYGATEESVDETSAARPLSLYAHTKVDSEHALLRAHSDDFHPTILRFATVFGLGYRPRFDLVVNLLTAKAFQEGKITVFNGEQWRPFIHVRDVVEAILLAMEAPARVVGNEIFNVGDSNLNHTLTEVARIVEQAFPATTVEHIANTDLRNYRVNFDKIRNRLGFAANYTVQYGVEELKAAFEQHLIRDYKDLRYHNQRFLQVAGVVKNKDEVDTLVMAAFDGALAPAGASKRPA